MRKLVDEILEPAARHRDCPRRSTTMAASNQLAADMRSGVRGDHGLGDTRASSGFASTMASSAEAVDDHCGKPVSRHTASYGPK